MMLPGAWAVLLADERRDKGNGARAGEGSADTWKESMRAVLALVWPGKSRREGLGMSVEAVEELGIKGMRASLTLACLIGVYIAMRFKLEADPESTPETLVASFMRKEMDSVWRKGALLAQKTMEAETKYKPFKIKTGKDKLHELAQQAGLAGVNALLRLMVRQFLPGKAGKPVKQGAIPWIVDDGTDDGVMWLKVPVDLPLPTMPEVKAKRGLVMGGEGAGSEQGSVDSLQNRSAN